MQLNITGHHVEVTPALRDYVTAKIEKIHRHFDKISNVHVTLSIDKKFQQKAEAVMNLPRAEIFADAEHTDMYAAIDSLVEKLDRQVIKHKEKLKSHGNGDELI
jgi:putative sigma-54 modulation protein